MVDVHVRPLCPPRCAQVLHNLGKVSKLRMKIVIRHVRVEPATPRATACRVPPPVLLRARATPPRAIALDAPVVALGTGANAPQVAHGPELELGQERRVW